MNKQELKDKFIRAFSFVYQRLPDEVEAAMLDIVPRVAEQPFYINRKTTAITDFASSVFTYFENNDKLHALMKHPLRFTKNQIASAPVPAQYNDVINRSMPGEGAKGMGIINIESLEGIGGLIYSAPVTTTKTETTKETTAEGAKAAGISTTTIILIVVGILVVLGIVIYYTSKN